MFDKRNPLMPLHDDATIKERISLRLHGSKIQMIALITTVGGLIALPEFAQAIGTGGAFAIAISNLLKARHE